MHVKFKVQETGQDIIIATTRPELLCTAALVIFNPKDARYKGLEGKTAITPVFGLEVKIEQDSEADLSFGTGLVFMSASAGDQDAIRFLRKRNIKPVQAVGMDGRMLEVAGKLQGMKTKEARQEIISLLEANGLVSKKEKIMHSVPVCERSKDAIEFVAMPEFYLKQVEFKSDLLAMTGQLRFIAPKSKQLLADWISSISIDWPISRRRYYATEIPLWYCTDCKTAIVPKGGKYYRPWTDSPDVKKCKCGGSKFRGEERVFDTWFDSSISPLYILKYHSDRKFFAAHSPCTLRPQGKEIIRTWLYYTLLKCYLLTDKPIFRDVWINYHIVDESGRKMSKSLGNVVDPKKILEAFGAEPFRLWAAIEGDLTKSDLKCSFQRIQGEAKTLTKLWNVARFISQFQPGKNAKIVCAADLAVVNEMKRLIETADLSYAEYDFHGPAVLAKSFIWEGFASHYLELVKTRAYNENNAFPKEEQDSAICALHYCLETVLKLLAPILPFITARLYRELTGKDVWSEPFPEAGKLHDISLTLNDLAELNSVVWKAKRDAGKSLKDPIAKLVLTEKFRKAEQDIKTAHGAKTVEYGPGIVAQA
ncbi:MAG: class I tRNA ligase family protein [Candidatus Aenigmarchaeota archaeon]|nr:class I tRNA ligase family protein [Candidatus Aenigmarchaeota archaeon]